MLTGHDVALVLTGIVTFWLATFGLYLLATARTRPMMGFDYPTQLLFGASFLLFGANGWLSVVKVGFAGSVTSAVLAGVCAVLAGALTWRLRARRSRER